MFYHTELLQDLKGLIRRRGQRDAKRGTSRKSVKMPPMQPFTGLQGLENRLLMSGNSFGHASADHAFTGINLTLGDGGVVSVLDDTDDGSASIDLGANTFTFYGTQYTGASKLFVSDNGLITFNSGNDSPSNGNLAAAPAQAAIAVMWDDWKTDGGDSDMVLAKFEDVNGDGINDRLIIEWSDVTHATGGGSVTFQAILRLNTGATEGDIILNYVDSTTGTGTANGGSATVGIKNANGAGGGADALLVSQNTGSASLLGSGQAVRLSTTELDTVAPVISITDISPDPRNSAVSSVTFTFDGPVVGFTKSQLSLTRDGGENLLTGEESLATNDGGTTWTLTGISGLTGEDGEYSLTVSSSSHVIDSQLNQMVAGDSDSWTVDRVVPTATITAVSPDPSNSAISSITITFSKAVTGFSAADLTLRRNDGSNLLDGDESLSTEDNITWTLGNLSGFTGADGAYLLLLTASESGIVDAAGNLLASDAFDSFVVDTTAPSAPTALDLASASDTGTDDDHTTSDNTPTVSGTAEAFAVISVYVDDALNGQTTADESGAWTYVFEEPLSDGVRTITATATDAAGNVSALSSDFVVTIDTDLPGAPGTPDLASGSDTGSSSTDNITSDSTPTIVGASEANTFIRVFANGTQVGTGFADEGGEFSITLSTLSDGTYAITATATDLAGNESEFSSSLSITVDTIAAAAPSTPDLAASSDSGSSSTDNLTNDRTPTFDGTAPAGSTIEVFVNGVSNGTTTADGEGNWSYTIEGALSDGGYDITAKASDTAGNQSAATSSLAITIDATAPTANIVDVTPDPRNKVVNNLAIVFSEAVTGFNLSDMTLTLDGGENRLTGSQTLTTSNHINYTLGGTAAITSGQGTFLLTIVAEGSQIVDAAGNTLVVDATDAWDTDTVGPTITITAVSPDPRNASLSTISITASEAIVNFSIEDLTLKLNGGSNLLGGGQSLTTDDNIHFSLTGLSGITSAEGTYMLSLVANGSGIEDGSGNLFSVDATESFVVDATAPEAPYDMTILESTNDTTPVIFGRAEAFSTVEVFVGGVSNGTTTADFEGVWSYEIEGALAEGDYVITAKATDAAGNESEVSADLPFNVDTTAPSAPAAADLASASDSGNNSDNITNDSTPTFTGTAEANSFVTLFANGEAVGSGQADGDGDYSITVSSLADGSYEITAKAMDAAGNESGASDPLAIVIDTTAPSAPLALDHDADDITSNVNPTIVGTAEANSTVTIFVGGISNGTTTADGDGAWAFDIAGGLSDGSYDITAKATDAAGNQSVASTTLTITIDTLAPSAPGTPVLASASDTGTSSSDNLTNDTTPTITGTAEANAAIEVLVDGVSDGATTADAEGNWTYTIAGPLPTGASEITAKATDAAGNQSVSSSALTVTIDTTAPSVPSTPDLVAGSDTGSSDTDNVTADNTPTIVGTAPANGIVRIFFDGGEGNTGFGTTIADGDGDWTFTFSSPLSDGTYSITASAVDAAGNESATSVGLSVTIDTVAPSVPTALDLDADEITSDTTPTISGTADAGALVEVYVDGESQGTTTADEEGHWSFNIPGPLSDGTYAVTAVQYDTAGNFSENSVALNITVDTAAPSAPTALDLDADDIISDSTPTITGTAAAGSTVEVFVDGDSNGTTTADEEGQWSYTIVGPLVDGTYEITATASDAAGNTSSASSALAITVDTTAPSTPGTVDLASGSDTGSSSTDNLTNDTTPTFTGTAEANSAIAVFANGTQVGTGVADGGGNYSITTSALAAGTYSITATATDAAGNTSAASVALSVTVDASAPSAPSTPDLAAGSDTGTSASDNLTSNTSPTVSGTAEANSTVEIFVGGVSDGTTIANEGGAWSYAITGPLVTGANLITARATDAAGNTSSASATLTITIDAAAPGAPSTPNLLASSDSGSSTSDDRTNITSPTVAGTAEANAIVKVFVDGVQDGQTTADGSGNWSYAITGPLVTGANLITATATDAAGNTSVASAALTITIDTTAPSAPGTPDLFSTSDSGSSSTDDITSDNTPTITGTAEANSIVIIFSDGSQVGAGIADGSGDYSITTSALSNGVHSITATSTDAAGNTSAASVGLSITIDTIAPGAPGALSSDTNTNDTTPTVTGTAEANSTVAVFVGGVQNGTTTADGSGNWSYTLTAQVAGTYTITAKATDAAGNQSSASTGLNVTIDTTAPSTPSTPTGDSLTNSPHPTYTGTAEVGSTVKVFVDGVLDGSTTADEDGNWTYQLESALAEGTYAITATATDEAGNASGASAALTVTVDLTAPSAPSTPDLASGSDTGSSATDNITNDTTPTFTGTAAVNSTVRLFANGTQVGSTSADGSGNWSITASTLAAGAYSFTATAADAAGNISSASAGLSVTIDAAAPSAPTGLNRTGGNFTSDTTPTIDGSAEANSTVTVLVNGVQNGTTTANGGGSWSYTLTGFSDGSYDITATSTDTAGNTSSASSALGITIDTIPPAAPTELDLASASDTGSSSSDDLTSNTHPEVTGTAEAGSEILVYVGDVLDGSTTANEAGAWSYVIDGTLATGVNLITAYAYDAAGNESAVSATLTVTVDTTAPSAPGVPDLASASDSGASSADNITSDNTPTFTGTAEANALVRIFANGSQVGSGAADGSGNYSITTSTLEDGDYTITARATDAAGNTSGFSSSLVVTVDTTAPAAPTSLAHDDDNITSDSTPTITGLAEAGATVTVFVAGVSNGTATANENGQWSFDLTGGFSDGSYDITATATDAAGNTSQASGSAVVTIDTIAPDAPTVSGDEVTSDDTPTLTGTAEANSVVQVFVGGELAATVNADGEGNWSFTPETPLADGEYGITARATDAAGNVSEASATFTITVDTEATTVAVTPVSPDPRNTAVTSLSIVFSEAVAGFSIANLSLTRNGGDNLLTDEQQLTTEDNITWTLTGLSGLTGTGGVYTLTLSAEGVTDAASNALAQGTDETWTFNTVAPTLTTVSTLTGGIKNTQYVITYEDLAAAANEADADGGDISFRIAAVTTGTLTKDGEPVVAGTTLLSSGEELVWTPASNAIGTLNAFTIRANDGFSNSATAVQVKVAVANPTVAIVAVDDEAAEQGSDTATFEVSRNGSTASALTVFYTITGTAKNGTDYAKLTGTVVIAAGQESAFITVTPTDDAIFDLDETVIITLKTGSGYNIDGGLHTATATIADNEPVVTIEATDATATEASLGTATFTVTLSNAVDQDVKVFYTTSGTATSNTDYVKLSGFVIIPAGQTTATITVTPKQDAKVESDETVTVTLKSNASYGIGEDNAASITIEDDEPVVSVTATDASASETGLGTATFTFTLSNAVSTDTVVEYTIGGSAKNGTDYNKITGKVTILAGQTTATVTVTPKDDALAESTETVTLTLRSKTSYTIDGGHSAATATIADNESTVSIEATHAADEQGLIAGAFTVTRSGGDNSQSLRVFFTVKGTATAGKDYTKLASFVDIPAGDDSVVIDVNTLQDAIAENDETVIVTLTSKTTYRLDNDAKVATVAIADNEPTVSVVASDPTAGETGLTTGAFTVSRTGSTTNALTVFYTVTGTAKSGSDYNSLFSSVVIPAGQASVLVTVTPKSDALTESNETVILTIKSSTSYHIDGGASSGIVTIADLAIV